MLLSQKEFLARAEAVRSRLDGAILGALSHHGAPSVSELTSEFRAPHMEPSQLIQTLCPGPLSPVGFAAVVMRELLAPEDAVLEGTVSEARVITGNARAAGPLRVTAPLVVLGDLEVAGVLEDCGPDSTVVVVGRCTAWGLQTSGNFLVLGDLVVRDAIQGIYNDDSLVVAGDLTTRFLDENDHDVSCYGEVHAEHHLENGRSGETATSLASTFLLPELWDIDWGSSTTTCSSSASRRANPSSRPRSSPRRSASRMRPPPRSSRAWTSTASWPGRRRARTRRTSSTPSARQARCG